MEAPSAEEVAKALGPLLKRFRRLHPIEQITAAKTLNDALHDVEAEIATIRRQAVRQLRTDGWTLAEIGEETGMTSARVMQLEKGVTRRDKLRGG